MNLINKEKPIIMLIITTICMLFSIAFANSDEYNITFINSCGRAVVGNDYLSKAKEGQKLAIWFEPYYAPQDMAFDHWIINDEDTDIDDQWFFFEMPDHDVTFDVAYVDAITSIELSGDFDFSAPEANGEIPLINASVTKVNGGTELLDKVNLVYAKWVNVTNRVHIDGANAYDDFDESIDNTYFKNGDKYIFAYKLETDDPGYAFRWYTTDVTIVTPTQTYDNYYFNYNFKESRSREFLGIYNDVFVTVEDGYHSVIFYPNEGTWKDDGSDNHKVCVVRDGESLSSFDLEDYPNIYEEGYAFDYWGAYYELSEDMTYILSQPINDNISVRAKYSRLIEFPTWAESASTLLQHCYYSEDDYIYSIDGLDEEAMDIEYPSTPYVPGNSGDYGESYRIYIQPKDGYMWSTIPYGTTTISEFPRSSRHERFYLEWRVYPALVSVPSIDAPYTAGYEDYNNTKTCPAYEYTGEPINPIINYNEDEFILYGTDYYNMWGDGLDGNEVYEPNDNPNIEPYSITVSLVDTLRYNWANNYDGNPTDEIVLNWKIVPKRVLIPVLSQTTYQCTGEPITPVNIDEDFCDISGDYTATNPGHYEFSVKLKNIDNSIWVDEYGETNSYSRDYVFSYEWDIVGTMPVYPDKPSEIDIEPVEYTGELIKAEIDGYDSETMTISGNEQTNAGKYTITITPKAGKWSDMTTDPVTYIWIIEPKIIPIPTVLNNAYYNGAIQTIPISQDYFDENIFIVAGDFEAKEIGTYWATVSLMDEDNYVWDNYETSTREIQWEIERTPLKSDDLVLLEKEKPYAYGEPVEVSISVYHEYNDGVYTLVKDVDYEVAYSNNINAGEDTATVTITGINGFSGTVSTNYTITQLAFNPTVTGDEHFTYTGSAIDPNLTVVQDNYNLVKDRDYSLTLTDNTNVGWATAELVGINNFEGEYVYQFLIEKVVITPDIIPFNKTYDGSSEADVDVIFDGLLFDEELDRDVDYEIISAEFEDANAGINKNVIVHMQLLDTEKTFNYALETNTFYGIANISPKVVNVVINTNSSETYSGAEITPPVTVSIQGESTIISDENYDVEYTNNRNVGTATISVTLKNNYSGSKSINFEITKAPLTITLSAADKEYDRTTNANCSAILDTLGNDNLVKDTDYIIENAYFDSADVGDDIPVHATVSLLNTEKANNYYLISNDYSTLANISQKIIDPIIEDIAPVIYDGTEQIPQLVVKDGSTVLSSGDYEVEILNNVEAGIARVIVSLDGNYYGDAFKDFEIQKRPIAATITALDKEYDGIKKATIEEVSFDGLVGEDVLELGTDYEIASANFDSSNVGENIQVTALLSLKYSTKANNYVLSSKYAYDTANITKKTITFSLIENEPIEKYYDATRIASIDGDIEFVGLNGDDTLEEDIDYEIISAEFEDANVGENKEIIILIELLDNAKTNNYSLASNTYTTRGTILVKTIEEAEIWHKKNQIAFPDFVYNGTYQTPSATVVPKGHAIELIEGVDYDLEYSNNKNANTSEEKPTITATLKGNYSGTFTTHFNIFPVTLYATMTAQNKEFDGRANAVVDVTIEGTISGETFERDVDYEIYNPRFTDINVGEYKEVVATLIKINSASMNNYIFVGEQNNRIQLSSHADILPSEAELVIEDIEEEFVYDGTEKRPDIVVSINDYELDPEDYTVEYHNNINAGMASVTVTLNDANYNSSATKEFEIKKKEISANVTFNDKQYDTNAEASVEVTFEGLIGSQNLEMGVDYEVDAEFSDANAELNKAVTALLELKDTAKANNYSLEEATYNGTANILVKEITPSVEVVGDYTYDGTEIEPIVTVKDGETILTSGDDYTLVCYDNINAGIATAHILLKGNYQGIGNVNFEIEKADIEIIITAEDKVYDGTTEVNYALSFTTVNNEIFVEDTESESGDYIINSVAFEDPNAGENKKVTATITLLNSEKGMNYNLVNNTIVTYANILPKELTDFVTGISNQIYAGSNIVPQIVIMDGTTRLVQDIDFEVSCQNNINVGTALANVTLKGNYVGSQSANFEIVKRLLILSVTANNKEFDYTKNADVSITFDNLASGETLSLGTDYRIVKAEYEDANIGFHKPIEVLIELCNTAIANNYSLNNSSFNSYADIIEKELIPSIEITETVIYDGTYKKPDVIVKDGDTVLASGDEYTVTYNNNLDAGTATVTAELKGNLSGSNTISFEIEKAPITATLIANDKEFDGTVYAGCSATFETINGEVLAKNVDYRIQNAMFEDEQVGEHKLVTANIILLNTNKTKNYRLTQDTYTAYASIIGAESNYNIAPIEDQVYTGKDIEPVVSVLSGTDVLILGRDYDVSYSNNKNVGTATISIVYKGNYVGSSSVEFEIVKKELTVSATSQDKTYDGNTSAIAEVLFEGIVEGENFVLGTDFEVISTEFTDSTAGEDKEVIVVINIIENSKTDNYSIKSSTITCTANILPKEIIPTIEDIEPIKYDGTDKEPILIVKYGDMLLVSGEDYTVYYENNSNPGFAKAYVVLQGNYTGTTYKEFQIYSTSEYTRGDVDNNGVINIIDVRLLLQYYIASTPSTIWSQDLLDKGDMDENGMINIIDVRLLLQLYISLQ